MRIGTVEINSRLALAPMAGVTDVASVVDRRDPIYAPSPHSDLYGQVMAYLGGDAGFEQPVKLFYYRIPSNPEVIRVEGTLMLYD